MPTYEETLLSFCQTHSEESLYGASLLSAGFIHEGLGPDEIVSIHFDAVRHVAADDTFTIPDRVRVLNDAHQFLLEVMIGYGAQYKEFLDLRLQEATRRAENAERSEREKLEVLAMIAHELGNPLTVALGNMQIAARNLEAADVSMIRTLISDSRDALDNLAHLTSQIVAASRGDDPSLTIEPLDLLDPVQKAVRWATNAAEEKQLSLHMPRWTEPLVVLADYEAVTSIVNNLLSNAIRYTPPGGSITVTHSHDGKMAALSVSDSGIGMTKEEQAHAFEKFYRSSTAKRMEVRGLGMGLNIAARFARAQGGELCLESSVGQGSTFTLRLPLSLSDIAVSNNLEEKNDDAH